MNKTNQIVYAILSLLFFASMAWNMRAIKVDNDRFREEIIKYDSLKNAFDICSELNDKYRDNNPDVDLWEEVRILNKQND